MQYYKVKLRLGGSTMNEIEKVFSAPEVLVLQFIHGVDAITNIRKVREENVNMQDEKQRLKSLYDQALTKREQSIDTIFGALGTVVDKLPENMMVEFGIVDGDDLIAVAKAATSKAKNETTRPDNIVEADNINRIVSQDEVSMDEIMG